MKKLAIIGGNGMVGSDLVASLGSPFAITRSNYDSYKGRKFDVVVNANGNSKRYWANEHPLEDFVASTVSVYNSIVDFPCDTYIYLSSPDVYEQHDSPHVTKETGVVNPKNLTPYGFHKYLSELIVQKYTKKFLILRCSLMLGTKLTKGPFYDVLHNNPLFISTSSRLQLISTKALADVIVKLLQSDVRGDIFNVGGVGTFPFSKIKSYFDRKISISSRAERQIYEMNVSKLKQLFPTLKSSEEYLQEFVV